MLKSMLQPWNIGVAACGYNMILLAVNLGFSNAGAIAAMNPNMFSPFGQLMVLVWGLAYLAVGWDCGSSGGGIWLVFALEKLCYVVGWIQWLATNDSFTIVSDAWKEGGGFSTQLLAPFFHGVYGSGDALFGSLFAYLGYKSMVAGDRSSVGKHD
eukprot:scaffold3571_cov176-Amphora_coffeaeformis.AAC.6